MSLDSILTRKNYENIAKEMRIQCAFHYKKCRPEGELIIISTLKYFEVSWRYLTE